MALFTTFLLSNIDSPLLLDHIDFQPWLTLNYRGSLDPPNSIKIHCTFQETVLVNQFWIE